VFAEQGVLLVPRRLTDPSLSSTFCDLIQLLDEPDWDIYYWSIGKREPPPRWAGNPLLEAWVPEAFRWCRSWPVLTVLFPRFNVVSSNMPRTREG
jgi:hypothetical protein